MKNRHQLASLLLVLPLSGYAYAATPQQSVNEALHYYCQQGNSEYQEVVTVGIATKLSYHQGALLQVSTNSSNSDVTERVKWQLENSGVKASCAQYLLNHAVINQQGEWQQEFVARVLFEFDKGALNDESRDLLDKVRESILSTDNDLTLMGHTDSKGGKEYNFALGLRRSQSVAQYLQTDSSEKRQFETGSYGETSPVSSNLSSQGRHDNRRVDIYLSDRVEVK